MHISERELELPDAVIGNLLRLAAEDKSVISLGPGEPDFLTPKPLIEYTRKIVQKGTHYSAPQGRIELREAICKKIKEDNKILPCSVYLEGEYGYDGIFLGVPVRLGRNGIKEIVELELSKEEKALLDKSAEEVKKVIKEIK